jgi:acylphosphatase
LADFVRVRAVASGRVQGVGFRAWAEDCAKELQLKGYVRNLTDGRVEAVFEGEKEVVAQMLQLMSQGPRLARVIEVIAAEEAYTGEFHDFLCRYTR